MTEIIDFNKEKDRILIEREVKKARNIILFPTISTSWTQKLDGTPVNPSKKDDKEDD